MITAVIAAGGTGERFGDAHGKQLAEVAGAPILTHAIMAFEEAPSVDVVVVVGHADRLAAYRARALEPFSLSKVVAVVPGGPTRQASVAEGVRAVPLGTSVSRSRRSSGPFSVSTRLRVLPASWWAIPCTTP